MSGELYEELEELKKLIEEMRIKITYLEFDVDATRRERDEYKKQLEEKK